MRNLKTNWLIKHSITVFSCVLIIVLGIAALTYADPVTTSIGENISTNSLTATGLTVDTNTLYVDSTNNRVGVGTITPATALDINGTTTSPTILGGTATTADLTLQTTSGIGTIGADMHFLVGNAGGTEAMTILNNGNVGIGTVAPNNDFEVDGLIRIDDTTYGMAIGRNAGYSAGLDNIIIADNMIIGTNAGNGLTDGEKNTLIGTNAGKGLTGSYNMYFGGDAGRYQVAGTHNVGIGHNALKSASGQSNYRNVGIGALTGGALTTGDNNVLIGHYAGQDLTSGDGNVLIGYYAGEGWMTTQSNKLVIANSDTATPLIYGEFDTGNVGIGTDSPTAKLQINSAGEDTWALRIKGHTVDNLVTVWDTGSAGLLAIRDNASVKVNLSATAAVPSYFTASNVGIGTDSPDTPLHIYDASATSDFYIESGGAGLGGRIIIEDTDGAGCSVLTTLDGGLTVDIIACP